MNRTVDLVVAGGSSAAVAAAEDALQRGLRVLIVLSAGDPRAERVVRQRLLTAANADARRLNVISNAEVVCVDGVDRVEAVVIRYARTGRLWAVNASAFVDPSAPDVA